MKTLVLDDENDLASISALLHGVGFVADRDPDGEPMAWRWTRGETALVFALDPATGLRTLVVDGPEPGETLPRLRTLATADIAALIGSIDERRALKGLQAAALAPSMELIAPVTRRLTDKSGPVAEHAASALAAILANLGSEHIASLVADGPFAFPGRSDRLQTMRRLARQETTNDGVKALLETALADDDWEISVTAMLAVARLGLHELTRSIARLKLPEGAENGLTHDEERLLLALRDAGLSRLGADRGRMLPKGVREALADDTSALPQALAPFASSLITPLPGGTVPPEMPGVTLTAAGPALSDGSLLAWVPPVMHWLGDEGLRGGMRTAVRQATPQSGFYIDAEPRGRGTFAEASRQAAELADVLGIPASLPPSDFWEMAARGPDGRRFPWGANGSDAVRVDLSPWGLTGIATGPGEWVGDALVAGGADAPMPGGRRRPQLKQVYYFRCVYMLK